jgi:hypothetical protein
LHLDSKRDEINAASVKTREGSGDIRGGKTEVAFSGFVAAVDMVPVEIEL